MHGAHTYKTTQLASLDVHPFHHCTFSLFHFSKTFLLTFFLTLTYPLFFFNFSGKLLHLSCRGSYGSDADKDSTCIGPEQSVKRLPSYGTEACGVGSRGPTRLSCEVS